MFRLFRFLGAVGGGCVFSGVGLLWVLGVGLSKLWVAVQGARVVAARCGGVPRSRWRACEWFSRAFIVRAWVGSALPVSLGVRACCGFGAACGKCAYSRRTIATGNLHGFQMPSGHGVFRVVWLTPWVSSRFWLGFVSVTCWVSSRFRQAGSGALNIVEGKTAVYHAGCKVR